MNFLILFLAFLPYIITVTGFIMWIIPRQKSYISSLSVRQMIGKFIFFVGLVFSIALMGASHHETFFEQCGEDSVYCYKFLVINADTMLADTIKADTVTQDSLRLQVADTFPTVADKSEQYVPFEDENNVKYINVKIGSANIRAVFDTGCSYDMIMGANDYYKLIGAGVIKENEFNGKTQAIMANGSSVDVYTFNVSRCIMNNIIIDDITCGVVNNKSDALVGMSIFKGSTVLIDNTNKRLIIKK